uniref:Uncharacterized protein n=1 Tax=Anguilla anguilla TaxID=7936 RepID=A0A0E9VHS1_ANGAN
MGLTDSDRQQASQPMRFYLRGGQRGPCLFLVFVPTSGP